MSIARQLGLGRLVYRFVHRPISEWKTDEARMARAARRLAPIRLPHPGQNWPPCCFLTGRDFWYQTVFCARSLEIACSSTLRFEFYDDGTLDRAIMAKLTTLFPHGRVISAAESQSRVDLRLPRARFPNLHAARTAMPLMRKLLDLHMSTPGPSLCLDSDMLFFDAAPELRAWLERPGGNLHLADVIENYVAPREELERLTGTLLVPMINTGIVAHDGSSIDWEYLEWFVGRLEAAHRSHRLIEQTLTAVHLHRVSHSVLPGDRYRVLIRAFRQPPSAVLCHYCWDSNRCYRQSEWRRFMAGPYARAATTVGKS